MKVKDWLWLIWGLIFPLLGILYFNNTGLIIGLAMFIFYAWLIYLGTKPKKDLEQVAQKAAGKLETLTCKLNRATEVVKADTEKRRGDKDKKKN